MVYWVSILKTDKEWDCLFINDLNLLDRINSYIWLGYILLQ